MDDKDVRSMDEDVNSEVLSAYSQMQDQTFARLLPASDLEERLVRRIVLCRYRLEQIENRFARAWRQLKTVSRDLQHGPQG